MEAMGTSSSACISYRMSPVSVHIKARCGTAAKSVGACTLEASTLCASPSKAYGSAAGARLRPGLPRPGHPGPAAPRAAGPPRPGRPGLVPPPRAGVGWRAGRPPTWPGRPRTASGPPERMRQFSFFIISIPLSGFLARRRAAHPSPAMFAPAHGEARAAAAQRRRPPAQVAIYPIHMKALYVYPSFCIMAGRAAPCRPLCIKMR